MSTSGRPLVGIAGTFGSGKDTIARHLVERFAYTHVSTGDMVRERALAERGSVERPVLHEIADQLRHNEGPGALVKLALAKPRPLIISGLRSMGEAKELKKAGGILLFTDAPIEVRYLRMKERRRDQETLLSLDEFTASEAKEWYSGPDLADFNLRDIKAMADVQLLNTLPIDDFLHAADHALGLL